MGTFRVDESGDMGDAVRRTFEKIRKMFLPKNIFTSKGSIVVSTGADTPVELTVGANTTVLTADSSTATGLKWALAGGGGGGGGDLLAANNLSELTATAATARTNLGLGSAATTASTAYDAAGAATAAQAAAIAASQPLDADLTAIAALTTTTYGRSLLTGADATTTRTTLGLGTAATTASTAYEVAGAAAAAQAAAIAASQPLDADLTSIAALTTTAYGRSLLTGADAATTRTTLGLGSAATTASTAYDAAGAATAAQAAAIAASQPLDSDLTAIAALTTTAYGRSLLTGADALTTRNTLGLGSAATTASTAYDPSGAAAAAIAVSQPVNTNLTDISALTTTTYGRSLLTGADDAATRTTLGLGTAATTASTAYATYAQGTTADNAITKATVGAKGTIVTGTAPSTPSGLAVGSNGQFLKADSTAATGLVWSNIAGGGDLLAANNLSELTATAGTARTNLGLGSAATTASTAYATAAQGTTADGAVPKTLTTAKGALTPGSGVSTPATLLVGADTHVLTADSTTATGLKWAAPAAGGSGVAEFYASPNAGGFVVGQFYDNSFAANPSSTLIGAVDRIELAPHYSGSASSIDQIGVVVSTAVAASNVKIVIYSSDAAGWPSTLLYESANIASTTAVYVFAALTFTFAAGTRYWVGVRFSAACTIRTIPVTSALNLGLLSSNATSYASVLRRTLAFATAAPNPWVFTNTDRVANITPPSIRFRAA